MNDKIIAEETIHEYQEIDCYYQHGEIHFLMDADNPDNEGQILNIGSISIPEHLSPYDFVACCEAWIDAALELDKVSNEDAEAAAKTLTEYDDGEF